MSHPLHGSNKTHLRAAFIRRSSKRSNSSKRNNSQTALTELLLVEIDRSDSDIETAR
jgi:hypothetical protein